MDLQAAVAELWPDAEPVVEPLGGGITNHNFKVIVGREAFVLRIGGKDTELLGIDREHEHAASLAAAALGVGPEVVAFADGCLVTRFIEGHAVPPERLAPADVGRTLRLVHDGPPIPGRFDSFRVVETYHRTAEERGVAIPPAYAVAAARAASIEPRRRGRELRPCHNDLLNANFIHDGSPPVT
jgi:thiamine kinase-like enzyme